MSTLSEESRQIVASLAHRVGPTADPASIAEAIVSMLQDIDAALTPADIAGEFLCLASRESRSLTGQCLVASHGEVMA